MSLKYKAFLTQDLPRSLRNLTESQKPNFGIMTAHHMVEHLIYVTKSMSKRNGEPTENLNKSQLFFRDFIDKGCHFVYRPKEGATVKELRTESMDDAIKLLEKAIANFYRIAHDDPNFKCYNAMTGELSIDDIELFHYQHGRWHLHQFGLIENFV